MYPETHINQYFHLQSSSAGSQKANSLYMAVQLFRKALQRGQLSWLTKLFNRNSSDLIALENFKSNLHIKGQYAVGTKVVRIKDVRGTEGRNNDFDASFNPRHEGIRDRWINIAQARYNQTPLPAVELIQVDETFFVRDGHHRISVARALGQQAIDAHVTVWEFDQ